MRRHAYTTTATFVFLALASTPLAAQVPVTRSELRGTWAREPAACSDAKSDGRIAIREKEIEFFASSCKIARVRLESKSGWVGVFRCEKSGAFRDVEIELFTPGVDPDPNRMTMRVDRGAPRALVRCPQNVPVR